MLALLLFGILEKLWLGQPCTPILEAALFLSFKIEWLGVDPFRSTIWIQKRAFSLVHRGSHQNLLILGLEALEPKGARHLPFASHIYVPRCTVINLRVLVSDS